MIDKELPFNTAMIETLMFVAREGNKPEFAEAVLNLAKKRMIPLKNSTYALIIEIYAKRGNVNRTVRYAEEVAKRRNLPSMVRSVKEQEQEKQLQQQQQQQPQQPSKHIWTEDDKMVGLMMEARMCHWLLHLFTLRKDTTRVEAVIEYMSTMGITMFRTTMYQVLAFWGELIGDVNKTIRHLEHAHDRMQHEFVWDLYKHSVHSYLRKYRDVEAAQAVMKFMRETLAGAKSEWDVEIYEWYISTLIDLQRYEEVEKTLLKMQQEQVALDVHICNQIIRMWSTIGQQRQVDNALQFMKEHGIERNQKTYLMLITPLARENNVDRVYELLEEMEREPYQLISTGKYKKTEKKKQDVEETDEATDEEIAEKEGRLIFPIAAEVLCMLGARKDFEAKREFMKRYEVDLNAGYNLQMFIGKIQERGDVEQLKELETVLKKDFPSVKSLTDGALEVYVKYGDPYGAVDRLLADPTWKTLQFDVETYNLLFQYYLERDDLETVGRLAQEMKEARIAPNETTTSLLLNIVTSPSTSSASTTSGFKQQ